MRARTQRTRIAHTKMPVEDSTKNDGGKARGFQLHANIATENRRGGRITPCIYGGDTTSLGGNWNTEGGFFNGPADACLSNAGQSSTRFIHLEQSYRVRSIYRKAMAQSIGQTLNEYFP